MQSASAAIGDDRRDRFHPAVDPTGLDTGADAVGRDGVDERLEALAVVVTERVDRRGEVFVGRRLERAVEQSQRLHPVLHLVHGHGLRRYRRAVAITTVARASGVRSACD